jgi:hypothetical protein
MVTHMPNSCYFRDIIGNDAAVMVLLEAARSCAPALVCHSFVQHLRGVVSPVFSHDCLVHHIMNMAEDLSTVQFMARMPQQCVSSMLSLLKQPGAVVFIRTGLPS